MSSTPIFFILVSLLHFLYTFKEDISTRGHIICLEGACITLKHPWHTLPPHCNDLRPIYQWTCGGRRILFKKGEYKKMPLHAWHPLGCRIRADTQVASKIHGILTVIIMLINNCVIAADQPAAINFPGMQEFWFAVLNDSIIPYLHLNSLIMQSVHFTLQLRILHMECLQCNTGTLQIKFTSKMITIVVFKSVSPGLL